MTDQQRNQQQRPTQPSRPLQPQLRRRPSCYCYSTPHAPPAVGSSLLLVGDILIRSKLPHGRTVRFAAGFACGL